MKVRQRVLWILGGVFLVFCVGFVLATYRFGWSSTGFLSKSLWDWLQLLIIPLVLAIGGLWFSQRQKDREQKLAEQRAQSEREIAQDNQQETTLQEYINKISELLLDEELCKPTAKEEARKIARVRTLTVLPRLNGRRKGIVLQFLYEAQLINKGEKVVDLDGADLKEADLFGAKLRGADLSGVYLHRANLFHANLSEANLYLTGLTAANLFEANLSGANLEKAFLDGGTDLRLANLSGANLQGTILNGTNLQGANASSHQLDKALFVEAVIMPDGTKHP